VRTHLKNTSVSTDPSNREAICSMARKLKVRFFVSGTTEKADNDLVKVFTYVIDADGNNCSMTKPIVGGGPLPPAEDLEPIYILDLSKMAHTIAPHCDYMPNPPYSDQARRDKISGTISI